MSAPKGPLGPPQLMRKPSPWLKRRFDAAEYLINTAAPQYRTPIVMVQLTEAKPGQSHDEWDRTCDRCGTYKPVTDIDPELNPDEAYTFFVGSYAGPTKWGGRFMVFYGLCDKCNQLEEDWVASQAKKEEGNDRDNQ